MTTIEWTNGPDGTPGKTWNPIVGCSRSSAGCQNCYAERVAHRGMSAQHRGLTVMGKHGPRWTGEVRWVESRLTDPLRWRKPRRIFVNSMSDLFHESVPDEWIDRVFAVGAIAHYIGQCRRRECDHDSIACSDSVGPPLGHILIVLTKRAARMRAYCSGPHRLERVREAAGTIGWSFSPDALRDIQWPLPNVHLGVSVEDQPRADERIPELRRTPAAVRIISYEPALGPVDFKHHLTTNLVRQIQVRAGHTDADTPEHLRPSLPGLDQIIVGGESGPGARPCDVEWIRSVVRQCKAAGVACFVKQLGGQPRGWCPWPHHQAYPPVWLDADGTLPEVSGRRAMDLCHAVDDGWWPCKTKLRDKKGGDMQEWPADLRVREFPEARA